MSALNRFLGDTPLRIAIKLIVISFLVGIVMAAFDLTPWNVVDALRGFVDWLWSLGFDALYRFWNYFVLGAAVVIPLFVVMRLLKYRRQP